MRVDPEFENGMLIIDSSQQWDDEFASDWFDRAMIGIGLLLGLQRSNDQPVSNLMSFDTTEPFQGSLTNFLGNTPPRAGLPRKRGYPDGPVHSPP